MDGSSQSPPVAAGQEGPGRCYLLVFEGGNCAVRPLLQGGTLVIGSSEHAGVQLRDPSVSRWHATITHEADAPTLIDLGSEVGTRVNGERIGGAHPLTSGDIIFIGGVCLVFRKNARLPFRRPILGADEFRLQLEQELERAIRHNRPLTLMTLDFGVSASSGLEAIGGTVAANIRLSDFAGWQGAELCVILPETPLPRAAVPANRILRALVALAPRVRGGLAAVGEDGGEAESLLRHARGLCANAPAGGLGASDDAVTLRRVGEQEIVVADPAMVRVYELINRLGASDLPVLILGETGSGKEVAAMALHHASSRREQPLVTVNCAAMPDTLIESELFGYEKGAFSGADATKRGQIELADGGTLFLDELGELSAAAQTKLLRVLETRRVRRLGALAERAVDVRIVAATNRRLESDMQSGRFRQDLYFRLSVAVVNLPPLRDRPRELPLLARRFLSVACARSGRAPLKLSPASEAELAAMPWPGNVRELKNFMEYLAATVDGADVHPHHLGASSEARMPARTAQSEFPNIYDLIRDVEREWMHKALQASGGVQVRAAELIGMPLRTFVTKLGQYGLGSPATRARGRR